MIYAVYDTNVLISSLLSKKLDTATVEVVSAILTGEIIPLYSEEILEEYEEVLRREKFHFKKQSISDMLDVIQQYGVAVDPSPSDETLIDMDDIVFYEVVMEKQELNSFLITGNKRHFPERTFIVTPAEMLDILNEERRNGSSLTRR